MASDMTVGGTSTSRVAAPEKVTTPARKTLSPGMAAATNQPSKTTTWYARGVGKVKLTGLEGSDALTLTKVPR